MNFNFLQNVKCSWIFCIFFLCILFFGQRKIRKIGNRYYLPRSKQLRVLESIFLADEYFFLKYEFEIAAYQHVNLYSLFSARQGLVFLANLFYVIETQLFICKPTNKRVPSMILIEFARLTGVKSSEAIFLLDRRKQGL